MAVLNYIKPHIFWVALVSVGLVLGRSWLAEHDSRILAEQSVKSAQDSVKTLQQQLADIQKQGQQRVQVVTKIVHDTVTPAQVVAAIPSLTDLPLATRVIPKNPVDVQVAAQPLVQLAGDDKAAQINLQACQQIVGLKDQQLTAKNEEIKALQKKPDFWHRVGGTLKQVGIGIAIGAIIGAKL